ncbi:uncharacterized protein LOC132639363 [Lycium barbarum]|uniref:uncharacterized protein LOC132639363 n=1 Tax=Lycium barbarum TaxID=112863 RepID=UPI00293E4F95|nr:uncharacterized protein LOC132639363 [Lycium barbarum]
MVKIFLRKWYPPSKRAEIRDQIYEFKQRHGEKRFEAWERYKEYLDRSLNHGFPYHILIEMQQTLAQLATNISLLMKRLDQRKSKKEIRDLSREQHPARKGGLPSDTIPNPKNRGVERTFAISKRKILQSADNKVVDVDPINKEEEVQSNVPIRDDEVHVEEKVTDIPDVATDNRKQTIKARLAKKTDDAKCQKFYDQFKQLTVNFLFLDAVKEMPEFAKFIKDLLTKKRFVQHETVNLTHRVSSIIASTTVQKKGDPAVFTITWNIELHAFARDQCDNGVSINLILLDILKQSGLGIPIPTSMRLQIADRSVKKPVGVVDDVLV